MNIIRIEGSEATVRGLADIPDLILIMNGTDTLGNGDFNTPAYATDRAIGEIQARGASVVVVADNTELEATLDDLFVLIDSQTPTV